MAGGAGVSRPVTASFVCLLVPRHRLQAPRFASGGLKAMMALQGCRVAALALLLCLAGAERGGRGSGGRGSVLGGGGGGAWGGAAPC